MKHDGGLFGNGSKTILKKICVTPRQARDLLLIVMTEDQAISRAAQFALSHGVKVGSLVRAELLTANSALISESPAYFKSRTGSWWLWFKPDGAFGGDQRFLVCDTTGKIDWIGTPTWMRFLLRINKLLRKGN